jgi:hypothetical protein
MARNGVGAGTRAYGCCRLPNPEGEALLAEVAAAHRDIAGVSSWGAISPSAVPLFINLTIEGVFGAHPHGTGAWRAGRELAAYGGKFPALRLS